MGTLLDSIDDALAAFIGRQHLFFVGSAPSGDYGHVNVSPKGLDTFRILGPHDVAYLDYTGSGAETIAHLRQNGRIAILFCAFEGAPRIVRLHGRGRAVERDDPEFAELASHFTGTDDPAVRTIIRVDVTRISQSCGYGVPLYRFENERTQLSAWAERKGPEGLERYRETKNAVSIDGLPALQR
jgi:hypothetical protein